MTPAQASSLRLELLAVVSRLDPVETQLAEGRPHAATESVAAAREAARRLAEELLAAGWSDAAPEQDARPAV